jgi:hypothetical protein
MVQLGIGVGKSSIVEVQVSPNVSEIGVTDSLGVIVTLSQRDIVGPLVFIKSVTTILEGITVVAGGT